MYCLSCGKAVVTETKIVPQKSHLLPTSAGYNGMTLALKPPLFSTKGDFVRMDKTCKFQTEISVEMHPNVILPISYYALNRKNSIMS